MDEVEYTPTHVPYPDLLERCKRLEMALRCIRVWAKCDHTSPDTRADAMEAIAIKCQEALGL